MHARALGLAAALVVGCERPPAKAPHTSPKEPTAQTPAPKLAETATCANGKLVPRGSELPFVLGGVIATASDATAKGDAVVTGACATHSAVRKCWVDRKYPRGTLALALSISPEGKLLKAKRSGGTVDDADLAACLSQALAGATFPAAAAGDTTYELSLALRVVKMIESGTDIRGRLRPEAIKREVRRNFPRLRACYEQLLKKRGEVNGMLTFDFIIRLDGKVKSLNVDFTESFNDMDLLNCAAEVMSKLEFPEPESLVAVRYPIAFETTTE